MILLVLCTGCLVTAAGTRWETKEAAIQSGIARQVLRFHVRANSESTKDQEIKMRVKEEVLAYLQPFLASAKNINQAKELLLQNLDEIGHRVKATLQKCHCQGEVRIFLKTEHFPEKTYGDCTFPAGEYEALVIELGQGRGHNWWCMLYPGLCFVDETYAVVSEENKRELEYILTEEEYRRVTDPEKRKISFRWKWLDDIVEKLSLEFPI